MCLQSWDGWDLMDLAWKYIKHSQQDGSVGKALAMQTWSPEFDPQNPLSICPLISTCKLWYECTCIHTHTNTHTIIYTHCIHSVYVYIRNLCPSKYIIFELSKKKTENIILPKKAIYTKYIKLPKSFVLKSLLDII